MQPSRVGIWLDPSKALIKAWGMFKWHDILNEQQMWILVCLALCLFLFPWFLNQFLFSGKSAFLKQLLGCFIGHTLFPGPEKNSMCYGWSVKHHFWISQSLEAWVSYYLWFYFSVVIKFFLYWLHCWLLCQSTSIQPPIIPPWTLEVKWANQPKLLLPVELRLSPIISFCLNQFNARHVYPLHKAHAGHVHGTICRKPRIVPVLMT